MHAPDGRRTSPFTRCFPSALCMLWVLAGCGGAPPTRPDPAETPQQAACRAESRGSPEVKTIMERQPPPDRVTWRIVWEQDVAEAERRHALDCLRRAGLALPGGVEAPGGRINRDVLGSPLR